MKMDWFRLYSEARNDAKLRALTDRQHRIWFDLLCFANDQPERGVIAGYDTELLALEVAGGDAEALADALTRLQRLRILAVDADGALSFLNWLKRQYDKPSDYPAAVRERLARHRASNAPVTPPPAAPPPVKRDETPCNADETRENAYTEIREEEKRVDRNSESNTKAAPAHPPACEADPFDALPPAVRSAHRRPTGRVLALTERPLPKHYPLTDEMRATAAMEWPALGARLDSEHAQFCRYYHSRGNETRTNWRPVWETWMERAVGEFAPKETARHDYRTAAEKRDAAWASAYDLALAPPTDSVGQPDQGPRAGDEGAADRPPRPDRAYRLLG